MNAQRYSCGAGALADRLAADAKVVLWSPAGDAGPKRMFRIRPNWSVMPVEAGIHPPSMCSGIAVDTQLISLCTNGCRPSPA